VKSEYERTGKLQRKIDIYRVTKPGRMVYFASTNWHRTCRDAIRSAEAVTPGAKFRAFFATE
jgi:hypothetical protein